MPSPTRSTLLGLIAGGALAFPALAADLSYKWKQGVILNYQLTTEVHQETEAPGVTVSSDINSTQGLTMEVVGVRRGDGEIKVTTDSLSVDVDSRPGGRITYDSTNPRDRRRASDPNIAPFVFLVGKSFNMTLNEAGGVEKVEGYSQLVQDMLRSVEDPALRANLQNSLSESLFRAQLEQLWHVVPGEEVEVGDTWETHSAQNIPGLGEVIFDLRYEFDDVDSAEGMDVAVIIVSGSARMSSRGGNGQRIDITESSFDGVINFAFDLGLIVDAEQTQDMIIEASQGGQSLTMSLSSTSTLELMDVQGLELVPTGDTPAEPAAREPAPAPAAAPPPRPRNPGGTAPGGKP